MDKLLKESKPIDEVLEKIEIELLLEGLYTWCGYDYRSYSYNSLRRRIWNRVHKEKLSTITGLLEKILHEPECLQRLIADFSINVTEMFRDPLFFYSFRENIIPILRTYPSIKIWHAGCATGEEVYSMAILLHEEGLYERSRIYATDINAEVLKIAKRGCFPLENMRKFTSNYLHAGGKSVFSNYYQVEGEYAQFDHFLNKNVVFAQHNLVTDGSFNEFNVILCRNVLIYFNKELQTKVLKLFYDSLGLFGYLGLGDKESLTFTEIKSCFNEIDRGQKLYRKTE